MKNYLFILLLVISFILGISTGVYRHFPYNVLQKIKYKFLGLPSDYKRNSETSSYQAKSIEITDSTGIYLIYGQSSSANHGQIGYNLKGNVFQYFEGNTYIYKDPSLGGTGSGGSVWGMVGDKLIEKGIHDKVVFSNCAMAAAKIEELNGGQNFDYLVSNFNSQIEKFGRVDGILFHQGESNNTFQGGCENYYSDFVKLLNGLKKNGIEIPIYLSRASFCGDDNPKDKKLIEIQNRIIKDFELVYEGPNTDLLDKREYRLPDYCHFSLLGYDKFSDMWVDSIFRNPQTTDR